MKKFPEETRRDYVDFDLVRCPYCQSRSLTRKFGTLLGTSQIETDCHCRRCSKNWREYYTMSGIEPMVD